MTAVLAVLLLASSVVTAAKRGSAENYFLGLRSVAALAVGALWHNMSTSASRPRVWEIVTVAAVTGGMAFSIQNAAYFWRNARQVASVRATGPGKAAVQFYQRLFREAEDPRTRFLTDVGIIDIRQGERTVFADSYKLKLMGENGQFDTKVIQENIDHEFYDAIVCRSDLFSPSYETYDFGLPMILAERARRHYRLSVAKHGLYIYHRRGKQPGTAEKPRSGPPKPARWAAFPHEAGRERSWATLRGLRALVGRVPELDRGVAAGREDRTAVGRERDPVDRVGVTAKGRAEHAGGRVPESEDVVLAAHGEGLAVGGEGEVEGRARWPVQGAAG